MLSEDLLKIFVERDFEILRNKMAFRTGDMNLENMASEVVLPVSTNLRAER